MDIKEKMYEISLKYNTLKMYENTIDQMIKNGASDKALEAIKNEKESLVKEIDCLLGENNEKENEFVKEVTKRSKYKGLYKTDKSFFDEVTENGVDEYPIDEYEYEYDDSAEDDDAIKKPRLADVQDKISNSKWVSRANFIFKFPKDEINIDEWRVAGFSYSLAATQKMCSCNPFDDEEEEKNMQCGGSLQVTVNDFSEKIDDYNYNILTNIILKLLVEPKIKNNLCVDIIDNSGELLYTLVFINCRYAGNHNGYFDYKSNDLNNVILQFYFKNMIVLAPNEELKKE